jgi:hypothetical protein
VGQRFEPTEQRTFSPLAAGHRHFALDELCGTFEVRCDQGVADRLGTLAVRLVPAAGPSVQLTNQLGILVVQARPEHIGEEVVVAVPAAVACRAGR